MIDNWIMENYKKNVLKLWKIEYSHSFVSFLLIIAASTNGTCFCITQRSFAVVNSINRWESRVLNVAVSREEGFRDGEQSRATAGVKFMVRVGRRFPSPGLLGYFRLFTRIRETMYFCHRCVFCPVTSPTISSISFPVTSSVLNL